MCAPTDVPRPELPDVVRVILKGVILSLGNTGLITMAEADLCLCLLGLRDA